MLRRHGRGVRALHLVDAVVVIVLLVTGIALGGLIPDSAVAWLGGHERVDSVHQVLGVAFAAALILLAIALPRRVGRLIRDAARFRRGDGHWVPGYVRHLIAPASHTVPFHDGRFDPAQRVVFIGILVTLAVALGTGLYLYFWSPSWPLGQMSLGYAIRIHIVAAWLLIACLCLHIAAGLGVPRTHRGLVRAMFGNGTVPESVARTLWPGWADRQTAAQPGPASGVDPHQRDQRPVR